MLVFTIVTVLQFCKLRHKLLVSGVARFMPTKYTIWQNKRMRRCRVPPPPIPPPPIIFERLKLPQQITYRRKWNLSESPNHQKYWENILISRFYKQFSRSSRNLGHFGSSKKFQTLRTQTYHISF